MRLQIATAQHTVQPAFCASNGWATLNFSLDAMFWLDILLTFRTGWVDSKYVIRMQPGEAAWNYIKSWLAVDLVSSFPFEAIVYSARWQRSCLLWLYTFVLQRQSSFLCTAKSSNLAPCWRRW